MADQISVIPTIDSSGRLHEFALKPSSPSPAAASSRRKKEAFDSHDPRTGERVRYQRGDDTISLEDLVRQERYGARGIGDMDKELAGRIVGDAKFQMLILVLMQDDLDYLDEHAEKMASKKDRTEEQKMKFAVEAIYSLSPTRPRRLQAYAADPRLVPQLLSRCHSTKVPRRLARNQVLPRPTHSRRYGPGTLLDRAHTTRGDELGVR
ncbi:hypothetical protein BC937DRAFT_87318 [Endogone sp. FLAS-F59071]|nr:hypothetical protein BC937DRAFT_87318 [Endogone sp. FLAS-F59071]|eukprot:RUS19538.1 hypothetical protein BC937DRAFT_87318 [Endogone sp. FLAS-F59071]